MRNYKISRRNFLAVAGTLTAAPQAARLLPAQLLPAWQAIALPLPHPAPAK